MADAERSGVPETPPANGVWRFRLYVAGQTPKALSTLENLREICEKHLRGRCAIEVIDLADSPQLAARDQIIATPTLIADRRPAPARKIVGDLSDTERVLTGLGIRRSATR